MSIIEIIRLILKLAGIAFDARKDDVTRQKELQSALTSAQTKVSLAVRVHDANEDMRKQIEEELKDGSK